MYRRLAFWMLLAATVPATARAASWADDFFDVREHHFGQVRKGTALVHDFVVKNNGSREARIKGVSVSCGCVKASASDTTIPPGGSATINALMDTSGFQGDKAVTIFVEFDKPKRAQVSLRVTCQSVGDISSGTNEVDFGVIPVGTYAEKRLNLDFAGNPKWEIVNLDYGNPNVAAEVHEVSRDAKNVRYEMKVTIRETATAGMLEDRIRLQTNDSGAKDIIVSIKARIEAKIVVAPDSLKYTGLTAGQKITRNLIVKAPKPFRIVRADNTHGIFEIRSSADAKTTQLVEVTLTVPEDLSQLTDRIELVTDLGDQQVVTIPIID